MSQCPPTRFSGTTSPPPRKPRVEDLYTASMMYLYKIIIHNIIYHRYINTLYTTAGWIPTYYTLHRDTDTTIYLPTGHYYCYILKHADVCPNDIAQQITCTIYRYIIS